MNRPCFLLQRALPLGDEPDDSPVSEGGDASGKRKICLPCIQLVIHTRESNLNDGEEEKFKTAKLFCVSLTQSVHDLKVWKDTQRQTTDFSEQVNGGCVEF